MRGHDIQRRGRIIIVSTLINIINNNIIINNGGRNLRTINIGGANVRVIRVIRVIIIIIIIIIIWILSNKVFLLGRSQCSRTNPMEDTEPVRQRNDQQTVRQNMVFIKTLFGFLKFQEIQRFAPLGRQPEQWETQRFGASRPQSDHGNSKT